MTTKEQERKALEQIKKILAGLDEDSYVATAMQGMIEDAENNIENDWAASYKDRYESAMRDLIKANHERKEMGKELEREKELRESAEAKVLTTVQNATAQRLLRSYRNELAERKAEYEGKILDMCDEADTDEFRAMVHARKVVTCRIKDADMLVEVLDDQVRPQ